MIEFNRGTNKFLRALKSLEKEIATEISDIAKENLEKSKISHNVLMINNVQTTFGDFDDPKVQDAIERELTRIKNNYPELVYNYNLTRWVYKLISEGHAFNEYEGLECLFECLEFEEKYQLEVIGYLLKAAAESFNRLEEELKEAKEQGITLDHKYFEKHFAEELDLLSESVDQTTIDQCLAKMKSENYLTDILVSIEAYKVIDGYIDEGGHFIGSKDIEELYEALQLKQIRMTANEQKMIIQVVSDKYIASKLQEEKLNRAKECNQEEKLVNQPDKKERWSATQIIKQYLVDDQPTKYISSEEFKTISDALITLDYKDEEIAKIQQNIVKNNEVLKLKQDELDFNAAKRKYLSTEEIDILNSTEALLNSPDPVINALFIKIKENFFFIKELLIKVYQLNDDDNHLLNDDAELIIIAIEEIRDIVLSYCYSDYRFALELTKKENE